MKLKILILFTAVAQVMVSCRTIREAKTLSKCEFKLGTLEKPMLAGVKVYEIERFSDLTVRDVAKVTTAVARGELPLEFTLNLDVKNSNEKKAAVNKLEWIVYIDDVEICQGQLDERIEVEPLGGTATIPLQIKTDLKKVTSYESVSSLFNFGLNLTDASYIPTRVSLKIKPAVSFGKKQVSYLGFIKVNKEFSSD